jgi:uncharacterized protein YacL
MSECLSYCLIGSALIGSMIMTMITSKQSKNFRNFSALLDDDQKQIYKSIIKERMTIYVQGLIIGVIIALFVTFKNNWKRVSNVCLFIVIALGFKYLYYSLYPKSTYLLSHLRSQEQVKAWLEIYKEMKFRCKFGFILGILGYLLLGWGWCN